MRMFKYVFIGQFVPVIFDSPLQHKDMLALGPVTSAGYFMQEGGSVVIMGEAISIPVKNGKNDQELLQRFLGGENGSA